MTPRGAGRAAYRRYTKVRDAAWRVLLEHGVSELPVRVVDIANKAGIRVLRDTEVGALAPRELGLSVLSGDSWYVVYDDRLPITLCRHTIAHELGHIFLSHAASSGYHALTLGGAVPRTEREADQFASRLLMPSCVIWGLGLHTAEEIARAAGVSSIAARERAERMSVLYRRGKFLTEEAERSVFMNFADYIERCRSSRQ